MNSPIIEVGLGLILLYMVLSVLVSQINNLVKAALNLRGNSFRTQIEDMLKDPAFRDKFINDPRVASLWKAKDSSQTSVSPQVLMDLMLDVLAGDGETVRMLNELADSDLVNTLLAPVQGTPLETTLRYVLGASRTVDEAKDKLVTWFDSGMKQASDLFKRRIQFFSFVVSAILVVMLNIDSLQLTVALWNNPVLREAAASLSDAAASRSTTNAALVSGADAPESIKEGVRNAQDTVQDLLELGLPIGWYYISPEEADETSLIGVREGDSRNLWNFIPGNYVGFLGLLLSKIAGMTITVVALMQGAPFWFDLLRRFTGQGTGTTTGSTRPTATVSAVVTANPAPSAPAPVVAAAAERDATAAAVVTASSSAPNSQIPQG